MTTESLRAFAARKGNAVSYWHKQKELGRLVMVDVGGKPMVDVERSEALIAATADPAKAHMASVNEGQRAMHRGTVTPPPIPQGDLSRGNTTDSKNATYMQAKTAREVYEAKLAQLDYERESGKLIKKQEVDGAMFEIARSIRDGLINCSRRIAAEVAGLSTAEACEDAISREHRAILENMERQFNERVREVAA